MSGKVALLTVLTLLMSMLAVMPRVQKVKADGTIYIRADGSIEPLTAPIFTEDNVTYTLAGSITSNTDGIRIERDNIRLDGAGYTVSGTGVVGGPIGIILYGRRNVTIMNVVVKAFNVGISLSVSSDCNILGNNITDNTNTGIQIAESLNNTLANNRMANNSHNFHIVWWSLAGYANHVDASNTVDGKPVYYWISESEKAVPYDAGYVALINCTRITLQNLDLRKNGQGALLVSTTNSTVTENKIENNFVGIWLDSSSNNNTAGQNNLVNNGFGIWVGNSSKNTIAENTVTETSDKAIVLSGSNGNTVMQNTVSDSDFGLYVEGSDYNVIRGNTVTNDRFDGITLGDSSNNTLVRNKITNNGLSSHAYDKFSGIRLSDSSNNNIVGNDITNNYKGVWLHSSSNNSLYHNNFISNYAGEVGDSYSSEPSILPSINKWDNGYPSGGNYWSDYAGIDISSGSINTTGGPDAIGDAPYNIYFTQWDEYPLMATYHEFTAGSYDFEIVSNSSVANLTIAVWLSSPTPHLQPGQQFLWFFVAGETNTTGFCRVTVPRAAINGTYTVLVDGTQVPVSELRESNSTHAYLYFTYKQSEHEVIIVSEYATAFLAATMMAFATFITATTRAKQRHSQQRCWL